MWIVIETLEAQRNLARAPREIVRKYEFWRGYVELNGPHRLHDVRGFRDEALAGTWRGHRSSRLTLQWRVIYRVVADQVTVHVARVTPHDYRR